MSRPETPFDKRTQQGKQRYVGLEANKCWVWEDEIKLLRTAKPESSYILLQLLPFFKTSGGVLNMSTKDLAEVTGMKQGVIGAALRELARRKILRQDENGVYHHDRMHTWFGKRQKTPENSDKFLKTPENSEKQTSYPGTFTSDDSETKLPNNKTTRGEETNVSESSSTPISGASGGGTAPRAADADGALLSAIDVLSVPGARYAKNVTSDWLTQELSKPENTVIADLSSIIDSVRHFTEQGAVIEQRTIRHSLSYARDKQAPAKTAKPKQAAAAANPKNAAETAKVEQAASEPPRKPTPASEINLDEVEKWYEEVFTDDYKGDPDADLAAHFNTTKEVIDQVMYAIDVRAQKRFEERKREEARLEHEAKEKADREAKEKAEADKRAQMEIAAQKSKERAELRRAVINAAREKATRADGVIESQKFHDILIKEDGRFNEGECDMILQGFANNGATVTPRELTE